MHDLLKERGRQAVLQLDYARPIVEAASGYLSSEDASIGMLYSGWTFASLPHSAIPKDAVWQVTNHKVKLVVEPGRKPTSVDDDTMCYVGVPFGSRARLILFFLQTEAIRTGSRDVELGGSLRAWLKRMSISIGGKSVIQVRDQADRLSRCRLTFHMTTGTTAKLLNQNIVDSAMFAGTDSVENGKFLEAVRLSEGFFNELRKHPVPLEEAAISQISNNSMALDVYPWLAYRLHVLTGPVEISCSALKPQFGNGYKRMSDFKVQFKKDLALALAVYPEAKVELMEADGILEGVKLFPSKPPVPPRTFPVLLAGT